MHRNSMLMFDQHCRPWFRPGMRVLEIGGTGNPTGPQASVGMGLEWVQCALAGVDSEEDEFGPRNVTVWMPDLYEIPEPDASWDAVVTMNVLEHVAKPWRWLPEVARIIKPGGLFFSLTPVSWPHHEVPIDCFRYYPDGMRALCDDAGMDVLVAEWGALNPGITRRSYPGESFNERPVKSVKRSLWRLVGWPMPTSYDLAVVARRREVSSAN